MSPRFSRCHLISCAHLQVCYFLTFPISFFQDCLQLHIFSFMTALDLCRISSVCRHWHMLSCDDLLWQCRLQADLPHWPVLGHNSNPDAFAECQSDLGSKEWWVTLHSNLDFQIAVISHHFFFFFFSCHLGLVQDCGNSCALAMELPVLH